MPPDSGPPIGSQLISWPAVPLRWLVQIFKFPQPPSTLFDSSSTIHFPHPPFRYLFLTFFPRVCFYRKSCARFVDNCVNSTSKASIHVLCCLKSLSQLFSASLLTAAINFVSIITVLFLLMFSTVVLTGPFVCRLRIICLISSYNQSSFVKILLSNVCFE